MWWKQSPLLFLLCFHTHVQVCLLPMWLYEMAAEKVKVGYLPRHGPNGFVGLIKVCRWSAEWSVEQAVELARMDSRILQCTPILRIILPMFLLLEILLPAAYDSTPILLTFYWWLYSHSMDYSTPLLVHCWDLWISSTDDSTTILRIILLSFYWSVPLPFYRSFFHPTDDSTWWFYSLSTDWTPILLLILSPFYWKFYSHSNDHSTLILLIILIPLYWRFYYHFTDDSTTILLTILLPFYWRFYSHSTDDSTPILVIVLTLYCVLRILWCLVDDSTPTVFVRLLLIWVNILLPSHSTDDTLTHAIKLSLSLHLRHIACMKKEPANIWGVQTVDFSQGASNQIVQKNHVNAWLSQRRDEQKLHSQRQQRVIRLTKDCYDQSLHKGIMRGKDDQDDC